MHRRLRQEGKLALLHEVKLFRLVTGGVVRSRRLRQEYKLVLLHEVKLCRSVSSIDKNVSIPAPLQERWDPCLESQPAGAEV